MSDFAVQGRSANEKDDGLHFLPVMTTRPMSRRDVELLRSSARSHLAKTGHRQKRINKRKGQEGDALQGSHATGPPLQVTDGASQFALARREPVMLPGIPDKTVDQHTKRLLHYCTAYFWPGFGLGAVTFHIPPFAVCYDALVAQGPALFHALLWQASVNHNFNAKSNVMDVGSIKHYQKALSCISQDIRKPAAEIGEETLYAILSLVAPEIAFNGQESPSGTAFTPPLAELAWLHAFGRQAVTESHAEALYRLIDLRGGINRLSLAGFSADINYMDLILSTQKLKRPHFPVSDVYREICTEHSRDRFFGHFHDFRNHETQSGFPVGISALVRLGLSDDLRNMILDTRIWVKVIERYHFGTLSNPDLSVMSSHRDLIQHRLLSLIYEDESGIQETMSEDSNTLIGLDRLIQTALLIFSLGVTFPVRYPPPFHCAGQRLKNCIEQDLQGLLDLGSHDFLLWLGILGALCATQVGDDDLRMWYVELLRIVERARAMQLRPPGVGLCARLWPEVKQDSLLQFLWCGIACDAAAEMIWGEVGWQMQCGPLLLNA